MLLFFCAPGYGRATLWEMCPGQNMFKQVKKNFPIIHPLSRAISKLYAATRIIRQHSAPHALLFVNLTFLFLLAISVNTYKKYCRLFREATVAAFVTPPIQPPGDSRCGPGFAQNRRFNKTSRNSPRLIKVCGNPIISEYSRAPC